jgi:hypothetical protein
MDAGHGLCANEKENIQGTIIQARLPVTGNRTAEPCGYVMATGAGAVRFCDAPAQRGSSYCAHHRALCQVAPGTPEAAAIAAELAREADRPPPPALDGNPVLEIDETEPEDALASLDLPRRQAAEDAA